MPKFTATIQIQIEAENDADAADGIHSILEPAEQDGAIQDWKYITGPTPEPELKSSVELGGPDGDDIPSLTFAEAEWGEWLTIGVVGGMEQKVRRPLNDIAMNSMEALGVVAIALHDRIAALEKTGPLELPVQV